MREEVVRNNFGTIYDFTYATDLWHMLARPVMLHDSLRHTYCRFVQMAVPVYAAWHGAAQCGAVRYGVVRYGAVRCGTVR